MRDRRTSSATRAKAPNLALANPLAILSRLNPLNFSFDAFDARVSDGFQKCRGATQCTPPEPPARNHSIMRMQGRARRASAGFAPCPKILYWANHPATGPFTSFTRETGGWMEICRMHSGNLIGAYRTGLTPVVLKKDIAADVFRSDTPSGMKQLMISGRISKPLRHPEPWPSNDRPLPSGFRRVAQRPPVVVLAGRRPNTTR